MMVNNPLRHFRTSFSKIVLGLMIFGLGNILSFGNDVITASVCSVGWIFILLGMLSSDVVKNPFGRWQRIWFALYMLIVIEMVFRGYLIDYSYQWLNILGAINYHVFSPTYILPYFLPLLLFWGVNRVEFRSLAKINYLLCLLCLLVFFFDIYNIQAYREISLGQSGYISKHGLFVTRSIFLLSGVFLF